MRHRHLFALGSFVVALACNHDGEPQPAGEDAGASGSMEDGGSDEGGSGGEDDGDADGGTGSGAGDDAGEDDGAVSSSADSGEDGGAPAECGNGMVEDGEMCDDGNDEELDGCTSACTPSPLGRMSAGGSTSCVIDYTGIVHCWGRGDGGRLGYAATDDVGDDETPASMGPIDIGAPVSAISAGAEHTCAVTMGGAARCWGRGDDGRLGYASLRDVGDDESPSVAGDIEVGGAVVQIVAGGAHTCAVRDGGSVVCWGDVRDGKLGYGDDAPHDIGDDEVPAEAGAVPIGIAVTQLAAGGNHTCARTEVGMVRCWGRGSGGRLGYGDEADVGDDETVEMVGDVDVGAPVMQITAGNAHTCALVPGGSVRCWGVGAGGRLGYGHEEDIGDDETPQSAGDVPLGGMAVAVSAGGEHTCALLVGGALRCWGTGADGRLGTGSISDVGDDEMPFVVPAAAVGGTVASVAAAGDHTCAVLTTGGVRCWGLGQSGRLGYGDTQSIGDDEMPSDAGDVILH